MGHIATSPAFSVQHDTSAVIRSVLFVLAGLIEETTNAGLVDTTNELARVVAALARDL